MDTVMELEIGPGPDPGSFVVRVVRSVGGGEPTETIRLDVDELVARRSLVEASVLSSSVSTRRIMSDTEAAVQAVGVRLFESTFTGDIRTAYRTSAAVAAERGSGVQISLRLDAPGLAALPWETLFDPETQAYLCRKEPLVRHVPAPHEPAALALTPPLQVLAMISSPRGLPALDVGGERERLEAALRPHVEAGLVELHWLEEVTWAELHDRLLAQEWHVLHFIGHGGYDTDTDEGVLAFVGRDGRPDYVTASSLADLLDEAEPTPRLVVLNSCQSGTASTTDLFSGTAAALAHSGIRAVAAMQFAISDAAAIAFARAFYTALAHGRGIDEAVRSGRIGILGLGRGTLEWVTPVLYLRGDDTRLFDVAPVPSGPGATSAAAPATSAAPPAAASALGHAASAPGQAPTRRVRPSRMTRALLIGAAAVLAVGGGIAALLTTLPGSGDGDDGSSDSSSSDGGTGDLGVSPSTARLSVGLGTDWTSVGLWCKAGDEFVIVMSGRAWLDESEESRIGPDGLTGGEFPERRIVEDANTASVIGRLDSIPERFSVGSGTTYVCPAGGSLYLGINDTDLDGHSGEFQADVTLNSQ